MRILIVDDEPLAREELRFLLEQNKLVNSIDEADSVESAFSRVEKKNYDVIFLDIELGEKSGFVLAEKIKTISVRPQIIFATAYNQYALDAFEVNAADYVLKPFNKNRIDQALQKISVVPEKMQAINNNRISITTDDKTKVLKKDQIIYVYTENGVLQVITKEGTLSTKQTLSHFMQVLDPQKFMQVHRSFLVNIDEVQMTEPSFNNTYLMTMSNGNKVPVARTYVNQMKKSLGM